MYVLVCLMCTINFTLLCNRVAIKRVTALISAESIIRTLQMCIMHRGLLYLKHYGNDTGLSDYHYACSNCSNVIVNISVIACAFPPFVANSTRLGLEARNSMGFFTYGATVSYSCHGTLRLEDGTKETSMTCVGNEFWNQTVYSCGG